MQTRKMNLFHSNRFFSYLLLAIALLIYLFFAFYDGVVICVDSPSYISMDLSREALYPSLLALFRAIFGEGTLYLQMIVLLQSLLAAIAAWSLTDFLRKELELNHIISLFLQAIPLFVSLLCRYAAGRASMYSNSILTEGIALPLFLLFFRYLLEYWFHQSRKSLLLSGLLSVLLISTRKQMYVSLFLLVLVVFLASCKKDKIFRQLIKTVLTAFLILISVMLIDRSYNYLLRGDFVGHSSDSRFLLTMVFYTAEESDKDYLPDEDTKALFTEIYQVCEANAYLGHNASPGWYSEVNHFGDNYDKIQIDTMWPKIYAAAEATCLQNVTSDTVAIQQETDRIMNVMIAAIVPHDWTRIATALFHNFLSGLVTTVAQRTPVLIYYSIVAYIGYLILLTYNLLKKGLTKVNAIALLTLVSILLNVGIVSAVIFCQTRYTIYNMAFFYMSGILLLYDVVLPHFRKQKPA